MFYLQNFFLKYGSKVNYHFSLIRIQRKKYLVRAVHNRREPQRHLLEKTELENSVKFAIDFWGVKFRRSKQEFLETNSLI